MAQTFLATLAALEVAIFWLAHAGNNASWQPSVWSDDNPRTPGSVHRSLNAVPQLARNVSAAGQRCSRTGVGALYDDLGTSRPHYDSRGSVR